MNETVIILMAKKPQIGRTKTRLYTALSPRQAVEFSEAMLLDSIDLVKGLSWSDLALAITPLESVLYFQSITPVGTYLTPVVGENIGQCLAQAIKALLSTGYRKAIALNSDSPSLPLEYLLQAADGLERSDLVFGPAYDGGYYLVGMSRPIPQIFEGIAWSTERVLAQTQERAEELGLSIRLISPWYDIDTPKDLVRYMAELEQTPPDRLVNSRRVLADIRLRPGLG
jgi:uncharacterized protein